MPVLNKNYTYGFVSILFHWLMAIILIVTFVLGLNLEHNFQYYYEVLMLHNSLGILIFLLAIIRVCWKWVNIKPDQLPSKRIFMKLATLIHVFFYILFFLIPITGYLLTNLQGDTVSFFGNFFPDILSKNIDLKYYIHIIHEALGKIILIMFILHVVGALYHHYYLKDNTLKRIMFFNKIKANQE